jgi:ketosteroid isomerase-like protein
MKRTISSAFLLLLVACSAFAQTAPDAAELTKLLNNFLAGASRNDAAIHEQFWADDLIYTRSAGRRVNKADVMHDVRSAPPPKPTDPKTVYTAEDIRIQQYGNTAVVAFRLVATTETGGAKYVANLLNSGTFVKRNGKWQVVNWQSTRMPRTEAESKTEVTAADAAFYQAMQSANIEKLSALTDPTFVWTHGTVQMTRQQLTDELRASKLKFGNRNAEKMSVSVYGDTAIVRSETDLTSDTLVFINQLGVWRAVTLHTTYNITTRN